MAEPRESIWSVKRRTRILYFAAFSILVIISVTLVSIYETAVNDKDTLYETWKAITDTSSRMAPAWVVISLVVAEIGDWIMVLAEAFREYKQKKQEKRVKEERAQGLAEGRNQGLAEGLSKAFVQWEAWNNRRLEAEKNNLPFNEPPPSLKDSENGSASS